MAPTSTRLHFKKRLYILMGNFMTPAWLNYPNQKLEGNADMHVKYRVSAIKDLATIRPSTFIFNNA